MPTVVSSDIESVRARVGQYLDEMDHWTFLSISGRCVAALDVVYGPITFQDADPCSEFIGDLRLLLAASYNTKDH